jgi:hypothetical protein
MKVCNAKGALSKPWYPECSQLIRTSDYETEHNSLSTVGFIVSLAVLHIIILQQSATS